MEAARVQVAWPGEAIGTRRKNAQRAGLISYPALHVVLSHWKSLIVGAYYDVCFVKMI